MDHERQHQLLSTPIERFDPKAKLSLPELFSKLEKTGGQPRKFSEAYTLWKEMLGQKRTICCATAGAPVPFGLGPTIATMIENRWIDELTIPGSQLGHDLVETLGGAHYQGTTDPIDPELVDKGIVRFWDTYGIEDELKLGDKIIKDLVGSLNGKSMTSREYIFRLGKALIPHAKQDGILTIAAKNNFPIYCPGIADSVVGTDAAEARFKYGSKIMFDVLKDDLELTMIAALTEDLDARTSMLIFGGGWTRNWTQQAQACMYMIGREKTAKGHAEAMRFSFDPAETGGLSGSTISEGISWRKYATDVKSVESNIDSNLAQAMLVNALEMEKPQRPWKLDYVQEDDGSLTVKDSSGSYNLQEYFHFS